MPTFKNRILEKLYETLSTCSLFTHTDTTSADNFMMSLIDNEPDKVSIAITGDCDITDGRKISAILKMLLSIFEHPDNVRILTGEFSGVEQIVRRWARKNKFELDIYPVIDRPEWIESTITVAEERDIRMANAAHCVIIINKPKSKVGKLLYKTSVESGKFVSKRIVGGITK